MSVYGTPGPDLASARASPTTVNKFGGNSTTEFGPLLALSYPAKNGQPTF